MAIIILSWGLFLSWFGIKLYNHILNPQTLFVSFISFIVLLSSFRLYNMIEISNQTYYLIFFGITFYSIGVYLVRDKIFTFNRHNRINKELSKVINIKFLRLLITCLIVWSIYRLFHVVIPLLKMGYPLDMIRLAYFGIEIKGISYNNFDSVLEMFVNLPFLYSIIPITAADFFSNSPNRTFSLFDYILIFTWIILSTIISGGRVILYITGVVFLFSFLLNKKNTFQSKRKNSNISIILLIILLIVIVYKLTVNRTVGNNDGGLLYNLYVYFCGSVPHTSLRLDTVKMDYTYGLTLISGFIRPLMLIYKYLVGNFPEIYQRTLDIGLTLQSPVYITDVKSFNAFVLPFYYFYNDFGVLGVITDSFIYGIFSGIVFFRFKKVPQKINLAKYLLIIIYIYTSMIRFSPSIVYFAFAYFYINFCFLNKET